MGAKEIRQRARKSRAWVGVQAGTSEPLVRLFEIEPNEVKDAIKRERIARVFARLESELAAEIHPDPDLPLAS